MKPNLTAFIAAAASLAIALLAAGCGSSASGSPYPSASYGSPVAASVPKRVVSATVGAARSRIGRVIVDNKGYTLYLFEKDTNRRSACNGQCATFWPPLLTHGAPVARTGVKQSLLGTIRRANGSQQVSYAGHPLYRYIGDTRPGLTNGEGSEEFGAGWDALSPAGKKIESDDG
jgi:predicted lipoprotein with Yx(FWY)xxD motif